MPLSIIHCPLFDHEPLGPFMGQEMRSHFFDLENVSSIFGICIWEDGKGRVGIETLGRERDIKRT